MATSTLGSGTLVLAGTTSGTTTVTATAVAGTTTLTLPAATDTLVGKATTDTLTNKTLTTPSVSSPTISDGTANGVAFLNGSKVLTTGSALSFDTSRLVVTANNGTTLGSSFQQTLSSGASAQRAELKLTDAVNASALISFLPAVTSTSSVLTIRSAGSAVIESAAGASAMTLDASGNLGIGTSSFSARFNANLDNATAYANTAPSVANCTAAFTNGSAHTAGGTFVGYQLNISGNSQNRIGYFGAISESTSNQGLALVFGTNTTAGDRSEKMRLDSSGNLLVGRTTTANTTVGSGLYADGLIAACQSASTNGNTSYDLYSTGAAAYRFYVGMGGTIFATSIVITAISDERLKENVRDIDTGLNSIMALKPRRFDWKEGKGQDKKDVSGFIAQEFEDVFPECVSTSKAGADGIEYKNINHETLIPTLVKAIQEQQALITQLTARITALETA